MMSNASVIPLTDGGGLASIEQGGVAGSSLRMKEPAPGTVGSSAAQLPAFVFKANKSGQIKVPVWGESDV